MHLVHVNLAKGFRGGERQTELLIQALSRVVPRLQQTLVCQPDSPMLEHLSAVDGLKFISARHQLSGHLSIRNAEIIHAHEAKAVHWAWLHHQLFSTPYVITRRVDVPVKSKWLNRKSYQQADARVAISSLIQSLLSAKGWGDVMRIPSAMAHFSRSEEVTASFRATFPGKRLVGHAGALVDKHKGQRVLIEAARLMLSSHPDVQFLFFGQGDDEAALKAESADLPNVTWMGFKANIGDYLAGLDLFAFPSRNEGLGSTLLDVMDCGVPIVASDVGGIPDVILHEQTGLLVPPDDAKALAQSLSRLLDDEPLRQRLVVNAKAHLDGFTPEAMAHQYAALYSSLVDHRSIRD